MHVERRYFRSTVISGGLVIVAIMVVINIVNIHAYIKRNREADKTKSLEV